MRRFVHQTGCPIGGVRLRREGSSARPHPIAHREEYPPLTLHVFSSEFTFTQLSFSALCSWTVRFLHMFARARCLAVVCVRR
eukprot:12842558-Alexandrium_andersonii.AAC.1